MDDTWEIEQRIKHLIGLLVDGAAGPTQSALRGSQPALYLSSVCGMVDNRNELHQWN